MRQKSVTGEMIRNAGRSSAGRGINRPIVEAIDHTYNATKLSITVWDPQYQPVKPVKESWTDPLVLKVKRALAQSSAIER